MLNDKINKCNRVKRACAYEPDSIRFHVNGSSAGGVTPQCWTSTWHRARPGSSNNVTREYAWGLNMGGGIGGLLNVKQSGQNYSYLYDGKGNVTAVIDSAEATAATYTYDAFGNLMVKTGSLDQPFQFSTKRYDTQTGLVYYGYRFYSPALGHWVTRDPLGEAGGMNLYGFVGNNPIIFIDPYGLDGYSIIGAGVGIVLVLTGQPTAAAILTGALILRSIRNQGNCPGVWAGTALNLFALAAIKHPALTGLAGQALALPFAAAGIFLDTVDTLRQKNNNPKTPPRTPPIPQSAPFIIRPNDPELHPPKPFRPTPPSTRPDIDQLLRIINSISNH